MQTLLLSDAYPLVLESAAAYLSRMPNLKLIGTCQNELEMRDSLNRQIPDILVLNPEIIPNDSLGFCREYLNRNRDSRILLFDNFSDIRQLQKYFKAGICGYLPRQARPAQLVQAVEGLLADQVYIPAFIRNKLAELSLGLQLKQSSKLTRREKEVLKLIIEEHTTKEIAGLLFISPSTVETHRLNLIHKLGVRNTAGLVRESVLKDLHV